MKFLNYFGFNQKGSGFIEYILIVSLVGIASIAAIANVETKLNAEILTYPELM